MRNKIFLLLSVLGLALVALTGCARAQTLYFESIPLYPGTKPLDDRDRLAEILAAALRESVDLENMHAEIMVLNLAGDHSWPRIKSFYDAFAVSLNWEASEDYDREARHFNAAGWTTGGLSVKQVLMISRTEDPMDGSPYLVLILFSK